MPSSRGGRSEAQQNAPRQGSDALAFRRRVRPPNAKLMLGLIRLCYIYSAKTYAFMNA